MTAAPPAAAYPLLEPADVCGWLAGVPELAARLGGGPADWTVREASDGNMNRVFLVDGPDGGVCVKQALPWIRVVGEGWPVKPDRALFEAAALDLHAAMVPGLVPRLLHVDAARYILAMELLAPHRVLRDAAIAGATFPRFAADAARFLADTLFGTSPLARPAAETRALAGRFAANAEMAGLTELVIFTDPYGPCPRNRWTSPQLDADVAALWADTDWKLAAARLKFAFLTRGEALLHGDLHTGSVLVTDADTRFIDPEFALVGPMGFDVGMLLGNLWMLAIAQQGQGRDADWALAAAETVWTGFHDRFLELWAARPAAAAAWPADHFPAGEMATWAGERAAFLHRVWTDAVGFAGTEMVRRIVGIAHVADLETIGDPELRAACERRCLRLARVLMVEPERCRHPADVTALLEHV